MRILTACLAGFMIIVTPVTLLFWILNIIIYVSQSHEGMHQPLPPTRIAFALLSSLLTAQWGLKRKSVSYSGAVAGVMVGFILTVSNYCFFTSLMLFFFAGSKVTKFRSKEKRILEEDFKEGGQRNWIQVICNGGAPAQLAAIYLLDSGWGERAIDFSHAYTPSWLCMGIMGALAGSCGDTFSSEIGSVVGRGDPWLVTSWRRVPRGTNGAVSIVGLITSMLAGLIIGVGYYVTSLLTLSEETIANAPPQWPIIVMGAIAGLVGSLIDSWIGATLQYSGFDKERKCIVEYPGDNIEHISGIALLDNHAVNLITSVLMLFATPKIALILWRNIT